jgi:hypothetical protein
MDSCSDAGNWLFSGRKWIDPADPDGRTMLELHHHNLSILFPAFTAACSLDRLIDALATVIDSWSRHTDAATEAGRCSSVVEIAPSLTATDSDTASPSDSHTTARHGGCRLLTGAPGLDSDGDGGWPESDACMGVVGVEADDELRPLALAASPA